MTSAVFDNEKLLKVWIYCLLKAAHTDHDQLVGKQLVHLKPGQFVFGRRVASEELRMKPSTVWDCMKLLEKMQNINIKSNNKFSVVTIEKWGEYQNKSESNQQQTDNKPTTNRQQPDTNNNVNNGNNENNDYSNYLKAAPKGVAGHEERMKNIKARSAQILAEIEKGNY